MDDGRQLTILLSEEGMEIAAPGKGPDWMLAGSLAGYPDNNWGHAWPQDDYLLQPCLLYTSRCV